MEYNFKRVHTAKDLTISAIVFITGIGLYLANGGLGTCIAACGLLMFFIIKSGYKKDGLGAVLTKKSEDLCKACKPSVMDFLGGKDITPVLRKGNEGGCVRLDLYYNKAAGIAYAQLYDFCDYIYEPVTEIIELRGNKAEMMIDRVTSL